MPLDWALIPKIASTLWTQVGQPVTQHFRRPRLKISFDPSRTYTRAIITENSNKQGCFCHLIVHNYGRESARNCKVWLVKVSAITQEGAIPEKGFVAERQLKWANEIDYTACDIEAQKDRRVDLCYTVEGESGVHFFFPIETAGVQRSYGLGIYRVRVQVKSDNAVPAEAGFDICCSDERWDRITLIPPA